MPLTLERPAVDDVSIETVLTTTMGAPHLAWASEPDSTMATSADRSVRRLSNRAQAKVELVALDEHDRAICRVPITFTQRVWFSGAPTLTGADPNGVMDLRMTLTSRRTLNLSSTFSPTPDALPAHILPVLNLVRALGGGARLGVWLPDSQTWAATPTAAGPGFPIVPTDYFETVKGLAQLQASTGTAFAMPIEFGDDEAAEANRALALLRGRTVTAGWSDATLVLPASVADEGGLAEQGEVAFESTFDFEVTVGGTTVPIGLVHASFTRVRVAAVVPQVDRPDIELRLLPAPGHESVTLRLLSRGYFDPYESLDLERVAVGKRPTGLRSLLSE